MTTKKSAKKCECGKPKKAEYDQCWKCTAIADGKIPCPNCKKGYYDAEEFEQCYNCNQKEEGEKPAGTDTTRLLVDGLNRLAKRLKVVEETLAGFGSGSSEEEEEEEEELVLDF